ncbi:MAG: hypothetical protein ACRDTA_13265 [Pseudonocardiaceae bacterium]
MTEVDFTGGGLAYRGLRVECDRLTRIARVLAAAGGAGEWFLVRTGAARAAASSARAVCEATSSTTGRKPL